MEKKKVVKKDKGDGMKSTAKESDKCLLPQRKNKKGKESKKGKNLQNDTSKCFFTKNRFGWENVMC